MRDGMFIKVAMVLGFISGVCYSGISRIDKSYNVRGDERSIRLDAGVLQRTIALDGTNVFTKNLMVDGREMLAGPADEVSFTIHFALPNKRPKGIELGTTPASVEALDDVNAAIAR